jgi:hypothetical protein
VFARSSEEHAGDGLLDFLISIDSWSDGVIDLFADVRVPAHGLKDLLLLV